jgi:hypothetical protein
MGFLFFLLFLFFSVQAAVVIDDSAKGISFWPVRGLPSIRNPVDWLVVFDGSPTLFHSAVSRIMGFLFFLLFLFFSVQAKVVSLP